MHPCPNEALEGWTWEPHECLPGYCAIDDWPLIKAFPNLFGAPDYGDYDQYSRAWTLESS